MDSHRHRRGLVDGWKVCTVSISLVGDWWAEVFAETDHLFR